MWSPGIVLLIPFWCLSPSSSLLSHMRRADTSNGSHQDPPPEYFLCFWKGMSCGQSGTPRGVNSPVSVWNNLFGAIYFLKPHLRLSFSPVISCFLYSQRGFFETHCLNKSARQKSLSLPLPLGTPTYSTGWHDEHYTTGKWI